MARNTIDTFWERVHKTETCWIWQGTPAGNGYGHFNYKGKRRYAHHWSYIFTHNLDYKTKLYLCHTCDNPSCVNPNHLYEGNPKTNAQDMVARGRAKGQFTTTSPTTFKKGHVPKSRKIDEKTARSIKLDLKTMRQCDVIRKYGLGRELIRAIVRNSSWKHLEV